MGKYMHKMVVDGRMTHATTETIRGQGKVIRILVFANEEGTGDPVGEWDMPFLPDYAGMATIAARQTIDREKADGAS